MPTNNRLQVARVFIITYFFLASAGCTMNFDPEVQTYGHHGVHINLLSNNRYNHFRAVTDLTFMWSSGRWRRINDTTLVLDSDVADPDALPVSVMQSRSDNSEELEVYIRTYEDNRYGKCYLPCAFYMGQKTRYCANAADVIRMPRSSQDTVFIEINVAGGLGVSYTGRMMVKSKPIKIKAGATSLQVIIPFQDRLFNYEIINHEKVYLKNDTLYWRGEVYSRGSTIFEGYNPPSQMIRLLRRR